MLEKTLESPLDCREIIPGCSLEGLMLKLKLQYFGYLMRRADSLEKTPILGKIEDWTHLFIFGFISIILGGGLQRILL